MNYSRWLKPARAFLALWLCLFLTATPIQAGAALPPSLEAKSPLPTWFQVAGEASELASPPHSCPANALVMLASTNPQEMLASLASIESAGGCSLHAFPPNIFIGSLPPGGTFLPGKNGILAADTTTVDPAIFAKYGAQAQLAAQVWNKNHAAPAPASTLEEDLHTGDPLIHDVVPVPDADLPKILAPQETNGPAPGFYNVSEYMAGKIAVGIILPESSGAGDTSTENWDTTRMNTVVSEIQNAMNWWANSINQAGNLSFVYDIHKQVPTRYEPINRPYTDDRLWVAESFTSLGYSGSSWYTQTYNYLNSIRSTYKTDWAVVVFVVDSKNDPDGKFTNGYFAYTYGFLIVMTYDNDGWGISSMDSVMAHEFAHNFGAADEYCEPGYACCYGAGSHGYLAVSNSNCEAKCDKNSNSVCDGDDATPNSNCHNCVTCVQVNCLMRNGSMYYGVDTPSRQQVGMRDSDGDGILDPVDTTPLLTILSSPLDNSDDPTPSYTGKAEDIPYVSPTRTDVTINTITAIEYRIDGSGDWLQASSSDGYFDEVDENFTFTTSLLTPGFHTITIRARNRAGNYSTEVTDTFNIDQGVPLNLNNHFYLPVILQELPLE